MSGSKLGKGGGRGTGRMVVAPPPPLGRGMAMPMKRQVMGPKQKGTGMGKGRLGSAGGSGLAFVAPSQEESFQVLSLDQGRAPFAMAIRLTPEVLEDLKRAEAEDVKCEMKFGITPSGHVIKVGSEEYKFSSAPEPGDLCDIYEEQQHGEDGNGVLKEAGSVWRKLSVLRILNASEKDRVKNRSKEAERQQKSRKAIILDPTHSLVKNQGGASGDVNGRRVPVKPKKELPKKMQKALTSSPVVSVTKPKPVMTTASLLGAARVAKAASVASPELPPPIQPQTAIILPPKGRPFVEERDSIPAPMKASNVVQNINTPSPVTTTSDTAVATKAGGVISPIELRNSLITLLTDNPKGLTIKAVEKAFGESMPHVKPERKTIEKAIKAIASYHAPGKYMLKEGVSFAKPSPGGGSSPEIPAAETPPLVDSPANAELAPDVVPEPLKERIAPGELGLLGERPGAPLGAGPGRLSSFTMQRCSGDRVSRAIRKADEKLRVNAERSQQSIVESMISHNPESVSLKEPSPYSHDAELISIRGDESPEQDMMETEGAPLGKSKQGEELAMDSPEGEEKMANSGGSDSSSSSDSGSDTDSDSHSGSESHSGTSRSGSGSDSDSDGSSSSGNEDENMDEDVEIVSEDEENGTPVSEDSPHLKPKTKDKKQVSRQAKEKQLKFKVSDKIPISRDSEEVDIVGDEAMGHIGTDSAEKAIVAVEVLDNNMEVDVDVLSVDGGIGSPQEWGSLSPPGLQRQQESLKGIGGSEDVKSKVKLVPIIDKSSADSDQSLGALVTKQNNIQGLEKKKDDIESSKQLVKGGKTQQADMDSRFAKSVEKEKDKAANLRGRGGIEIHNNRLAAAKESPVHNASPFRSDMPSKSSLGSPAVNNDVVDTSCQPGKESMAKRHANPEFLKTFPKDAGAAVKTVVDWETDELGERTLSEKAVADKNVGEKIVGALNKPLQRPGKGAEKPNPLSKQPVEMPQHNVASRNTDVSSTILREAEPVAVAGRKTDAAFTQSSKEPESTKRVPRDLNLQNNPDAGLLGKPGKDLGNRQLKRDMDSQGTNSYKEPGLVVRPGRDPKQARRQSLEPAPAVPQQNESLKKTDVWGKPTKDIDMAARTCNDGVAQNSSFRDGRKKETITQEPAKGMLKINNNDAVSKHNEKRATESSDLEVGELQESTGDVKTSDQTRKDGTQVEAVKGWEIVEQATSNKPLVHKGQVSPPKDKAQGTGKAAGNLRKDSPITAETRKPILLTHKEVQRVDQVAARETGRTTTGILKPDNILQEERLDAVSALKSRVSLSESAERPQEMRGLKRLAEDGDNQEPAARVYKKPSVTPVPPQLPVNCSVHSNTAPVSKLEKTSAVQDIAPRPPNAELNRGGPLDVLLNHAAPSSKASSAENGRKQWPYVKGQEDREKEGFEQQSGQEPDRKPKISASVLAPGNKISALPDSGQSNGKWANLSGSCDGADEKDYFLMYEKNAPELRGPAVTYEQAEKYKREYEEKYIIYRRLYDDIEDTRLDFATFKREIERASNAPEKLQQVRSQIQMTYHAVHKRSKRMQKTFNVLHDELLTIKQHLKDFAEKAGQG